MIDYQKLYAHLVGQVDKALELLEAGDLVKAGPIRKLLQECFAETREKEQNITELLFLYDQVKREEDKNR